MSWETITLSGLHDVAKLCIDGQLGKLGSKDSTAKLAKLYIDGQPLFVLSKILL